MVRKSLGVQGKSLHLNHAFLTWPLLLIVTYFFSYGRGWET